MGTTKKITSSQRIIPIGLTCPQTGFHNFGASDISGKTYPFPTLSFRAQREIFFVPFFPPPSLSLLREAPSPPFLRYSVSHFSLPNTLPLTANEKDPSAPLEMTIREEHFSSAHFIRYSRYPSPTLSFRAQREIFLALCSFLLLSQKVSPFPLSHIRHYPLLQERSLDFARDDNEDGALLSLFSCRHAKECLFEAH